MSGAGSAVSCPSFLNQDAGVGAIMRMMRFEVVDDDDCLLSNSHSRDVKIISCK